jgi:arylsulfatase A-like enzyme
LIVLDTLRADHLGRRDERGSLTPALDALGADAVVFPNAFAPSNWTRGSMPGLLASLPSEVTGNAPPASVELLAEHLQKAGFHTSGLSANPLIAERLGWAQGFDRFDDPNTMGEFLVSHLLQTAGAAAPAEAYRIGAVRNSSYFRAAAEMRRRADRLLADSARPAFLYVQAMDPHGPYLPPPAALPPDFRWSDVFSYYRFMKLRGTAELGSEAFRPKLENFRQRYAASVRSLDGEIGRLLDGLRARGRYDETLIVVTADHGEAFGENGWAGHTGLELGPALVRVPFLVKAPKSWGVAPRSEPTAISGYSLLPTLLGLLALPVPPGAFGSDLSGLIRNGVAPPPETLFVESADAKQHIYAAIRWPWKLVELPEREPAVRGLYDLAADPAEAHSRADEHPELVAELRREIQGFRERVERARVASSGAEIDARTQEQLRRLGYIQ